MLFPFVPSFVVRLALYSILSLCVVFIIPQEWGILWYNWVRVYCRDRFHSTQGCHVQKNHSAQKNKGDTLEVKEPHWRFTLNHLGLDHHVPVVPGGGGGGDFGVFLDWMWPCSSSQCLCRQTLIDFDRVRYFLLRFPAFVFVSRPPYICLLLCLPIMTLLYSQMLFPCII